MQRYNYVAQELAQRRQRLTLKEPEIRNCLNAIDLLIHQKTENLDSVGPADHCNDVDFDR